MDATKTDNKSCGSSKTRDQLELFSSVSNSLVDVGLDLQKITLICYSGETAVQINEDDLYDFAVKYNELAESWKKVAEPCLVGFLKWALVEGS